MSEEQEIQDFQPVSTTNPFKQFEAWYEEAKQCKELYKPLYMCLSTATKDGRSSSRLISLASHSERGLLFITFTHSRKYQELEENPYVSAFFAWDPIYKHVRVEGKVERISAEEVDKMFQFIPLQKRISMMASPQDQPIETKAKIHAKFSELLQQYQSSGEPVPTPATAVGYLIVPHMFEFYRGFPKMGLWPHLCDRVVFNKKESSEEWSFTRIGLCHYTQH